MGFGKRKVHSDCSKALHVSELAYNEYGAMLYRYALMILTDHGMAEDVIQLVFMKFIKMGKKIDDFNEIYYYLRKAVRNESFKLLQKNRANEAFKQSYGLRPLLEPTRGDVPVAEQKIIEEAICKLPVAQREVVHMKIFENMTFREIAELLDESINTIASRYKYAIEKLRFLIPADIVENIYEQR